MTQRILAALLALFFATGAAAPAAALTSTAPSAHPMTAQDLNAFFGGMVPYAIRRGDIAGAVLVVVKDGKVLFEHGYGYANIDKHEPVLPNRTLFRPGSISKLFTWTAVMQLVQAGKINLDTDVNQYLDFKIPPKYGKPITMRDLMTHSAGFEEALQALITEKPHHMIPLRTYLVKHMPERIFPPFTVIAYSNYGAALAGYIVQRVSGEPFDQYIENHILRPLRMNHSSFDQPLPARLAPLLASGYTTASNDKPKPFEYVIPSPAGAASATASDMARFMLAYLNGGTYQGGTILDPATIKEMWTPQLLPAPGMNGFCLGFYQENRNGLEIVGHAGDTNYFHSDLHLLPKEHVGIFMSFNSAGKKGAVEAVRVQIFRHFLDRYYPYTPPVQATVADPQKDAARVDGWYESSRRSDSALRFVYMLSQSSVTSLPNGDLEVSMLTDPSGSMIRWREVGPLYYRQIHGQSYLKFTTDSQGNVATWTSTDFIPVETEQRVNGLASWGSAKTLLPIFIAVVVLSLLVRLGAWIARRKLGLTLGLDRREQWLHLAARIGAIAFIAALAGWMLALSNTSAILEASFVKVMIVLYTIGLIAIIGGFAMVGETVVRVLRGPGGWLVRSGEILVALAAIYGIWFFIFLGLANFVTHF